MQFATVNANFWQRVASMATTRFFVNELPVLGIENTFKIFNADSLKRIL